MIISKSLSAQSSTKYPTLIHFGAAQGLKRTVAACLQHCPAARQACALQNKDGMCPRELAEKYGYFEVSEDLEDFEVTLSLNELNPAYKKTRLFSVTRSYQEPITGSVKLPQIPVTAFSQTYF